MAANIHETGTYVSMQGEWNTRAEEGGLGWGWLWL